MDVIFWGVPFNPLTVVKGKIIMTQVKIVRKTLFRNVVIGVNYCCRGESQGGGGGEVTKKRHQG